MGFEPCLSALERPTRAVRSETVAVRSFTSSVKSVMGITSHQMEGSARHEGCRFLLIVTQNLFQHIHRRAANRISLSGIEKIAYLDFRPNAHGAIAYIARMF